MLRRIRRPGRSSSRKNDGFHGFWHGGHYGRQPNRNGLYKFLGTQELAALGFSFPIIMLIQSTAMGLSVGASSVVSRKIGEGKHDLGRLVATHCLLFSLLLSLVLIIVVSPNLAGIFELLGAQENVRSLATSYVDLWFIGLPFFAFAMVGSSLMRAMGDIARPGYLMALAALLQIVFAPALIFGVNGFSGFGLAGAALAFVMARVIGFAVYIYLFYRDKSLILSTKSLYASLKSAGRGFARYRSKHYWSCYDDIRHEDRVDLWFSCGCRVHAGIAN